MIKDCGQNAVLMLSQYWDTCKQITGSENTMVFSLRDVLTMFWWFRKWIDVWMFLFSQLRKRKYSIAVLQYYRSLCYVWSSCVVIKLLHTSSPKKTFYLVKLTQMWAGEPNLFLWHIWPLFPKNYGNNHFSCNKSIFLRGRWVHKCGAIVLKKKHFFRASLTL